MWNYSDKNTCWSVEFGGYLLQKGSQVPEFLARVCRFLASLTSTWSAPRLQFFFALELRCSVPFSRSRSCCVGSGGTNFKPTITSPLEATGSSNGSVCEELLRVGDSRVSLLIEFWKTHERQKISQSDFVELLKAQHSTSLPRILIVFELVKDFASESSNIDMANTFENSRIKKFKLSLHITIYRDRHVNVCHDKSIREQHEHVARENPRRLAFVSHFYVHFSRRCGRNMRRVRAAQRDDKRLCRRSSKDSPLVDISAQEDRSDTGQIALES